VGNLTCSHHLKRRADSLLVFGANQAVRRAKLGRVVYRFGQIIKKNEGSRRTLLRIIPPSQQTASLRVRSWRVDWGERAVVIAWSCFSILRFRSASQPLPGPSFATTPVHEDTLHHCPKPMRSVRFCGHEQHQRFLLVSDLSPVQPRDRTAGPGAFLRSKRSRVLHESERRRDLFISPRVADYEPAGSSRSRQPSCKPTDCTTAVNLSPFWNSEFLLVQLISKMS
jgi:hypothetical protein